MDWGEGSFMFATKQVLRTVIRKVIRSCDKSASNQLTDGTWYTKGFSVGFNARPIELKICRSPKPLLIKRGVYT
eukprot:scaffold10270_cov125-Cylindrotheca_fusiformis.AAC.6